MTWDEKFMDAAKLKASWSKDQGRKVGAVIVNDDHIDITSGYNGLPSGVNDNVEERHERPEKYLWSEHAERNAIYFAARLGHSTKGCTIYSTLFPCAGCARAIIQSGIKRVVSYVPNFEDEKYGHEWDVAMAMFGEANVEVKFIL